LNYDQFRGTLFDPVYRIFWGVFGWLALKIRKALGEKISKNIAILLYAIVLLFPLIFPFVVGWVK
jgi:hypothetical protein